MLIDTLTIIICCGLVLLAVVSSLCNGLLRRPRKQEETSGQQSAPRLSVIITAHDNACELERNLPAILSQAYEPGFEVIVVDESSTDNTEDVLKLLKNRFTNLYTTFIPESSHYLSRRKLALTVGVKAAKNEWLILTDADCRPESANWLKAMSEHCTDDKDMVMGYTNYQHDAKCFYRFERLLTSCYLLRTATAKQPYRYNGNNLALRKSIFMKHNGFLKNLKFLRGEYDFIVNEYAQPGRTATAITPDCIMRQDSPSCKSWTNTGLYYMETRMHLQRSFGYRTLFNIDTFLLHLNYLSEIGIGVWATLNGNHVMTATAAIAILITLATRVFIASKTIKSFGEHIPLFKVPIFELKIVWHNTWLMLRHRMADKYDFIIR